MHKYFGEVLDLCLSGNEFERVQRAKEIQSFLGDTEGQFAHYLDEVISKEQLAKVILKMADTLCALEQSGSSDFII